MMCRLCAGYTKKAGARLEIESGGRVEQDFQQAAGALLSLLRWLLWRCLVTVCPMCHPGGWLQQGARGCPGGQCANHLAPRPQRLHQQPPLATHSTACRS
ncbi:hypothetical protein IG631_10386 [Alternaria alternata]|nr:hypothetical protein IG631_10386 [Alternaria alternata]